MACSGSIIYFRNPSSKKGVVNSVHYSELCLPARESGCGGTEVYALVNGEIVCGIDAVLFQNIFKDHLRHTAGSAAQYIFTHQHIPAEIVDRFSGNQEIAGALGQLGEIHSVVGGTFFISIDCAFTAHETDVSLSC
mgnify:CR=1 FL=1